MWSPRALKAAFRLESRNRTASATPEPEPGDPDHGIQTQAEPPSHEVADLWEDDAISEGSLGEAAPDDELLLLDEEDEYQAEDGEGDDHAEWDAERKTAGAELSAGGAMASCGTCRSGDGWVARADREGGFLFLARGRGLSEPEVAALPRAVEAAAAGALPPGEAEDASMPSSVTAVISLLRAVHQDLRQRSEVGDSDGIDCLVAIAARGRIYLVLAGRVACLRFREGEWEVLAPLGRRARPALGQSPRALIEVINEPARPMDLLLAVPGGPEHDLGEIPSSAWEVAVGVGEWVLRADGPLPAVDLEPDVSASPHAAIVYGGDLIAFREAAQASAEEGGIIPFDVNGLAPGMLPAWLAGTPDLEMVEAASGQEGQGARRHRLLFSKFLSVFFVLAILTASLFLALEALGQKDLFDGLLATASAQFERIDAALVRPLRGSLERAVAASAGFGSSLLPDPTGEEEGGQAGSPPGEDGGGDSGDPALDPAGLRRVIPGPAGSGGGAGIVGAGAQPAKVGGIEARTEPLTDGIEVFVDERLVGTAPAAVDSVPPGRHRVRFASADGYHWEEEVMVRADEVARAVAPFSEGEMIALVTVQTSAMTDEGLSSQGGNAVTVDGEAKGQTPIDLALEPGVHGITVEREGLKPIHRVINLRRGDRLILDLRLDKLPQGSIEHSPPAKLKAGETFILTASYGGVRVSPHQKLKLHWTIDGVWVESAMTSIPGAPGSYVIGLPVPEGTRDKLVRYFIATEYTDGSELVTPIFRVPVR